MKLSYLTILAVLLTLPQTSWAVRQAGNIPPVANTSGIIERGGMITAIDPEHKTIGVDGITYPYPASSVSIHSDVPGATGAKLKLEQGMLIRFSTVKEKNKNGEVISEIWIAKPKAQAPIQ